MEISKLGKGRCIILAEKPYRIRDIRNVVISKHSHTRTKVVLEDVFTGEKIEKTLPPHENVREIDIPRKRGQLIAKLGDTVHIMDLVSFQTFDAMINQELLNELTEGDEVTFVDYNGVVRVLEKRTS
jgi:translation initiation factor 5A